ncbi:O-methylsterigmatocystin oxidoreductase [Coprinopsis marcescibilis]|uniref:O-methylsterigmatocystin oxidoreductase n=1 Tax=Coprinopsis marcescibilis TaxID=230819 RepID=A0A5C3KKN9_COPMA|nr:O-methylsterigmatocystin oxidoreductase [Coprinopsis marcescibilis]
MIPTLSAVLGIVLAAVVLVRLKRNRSVLPLPPGPKPLPIFGNLFDIPKLNAWEKYRKMCRENGGMVYLTFFGHGLLVLGTAEMANDLLDKSSAEFSDRPPSVIRKMVEMDWVWGLLNYGNEWRDRRRMFHQHVGKSGLLQYHAIFYDERDKLLRELAQAPDQFRHLFRMFFGKSIMRMSYGVNDDEWNKNLILESEQLFRDFTEVTRPGRLWVSTLPSLKHIPGWLPGAGFQRRLAELTKISRHVLNSPFQKAMDDLNNPDKIKGPSMAASFIENSLDDPSKQLDARSVCAQAYLAGIDSTVTAATGLVIALAKYPHVQQNGLEEIESIVGTGILPTLQDRDSLPYIQAIVRELTRWHVVAPLAVPHVSSVDTEYKGYFIPKGTIVFANVWSYLHNPEVFPDPKEFKPERFLKDGLLDTELMEKASVGFGFGRRICPGRFMSDELMFILVTSLICGFKISSAKDANGDDIPLDLKIQATSSIATPAPFECHIEARPLPNLWESQD